MTRAFICLARNDLSLNELQILDLQPNSSLRNYIYDPAGQTGYVSFFRQNDLPTVSGAGPILASSTVYGLRAYLLSNIDNQSLASHITPSVANCTTIANAILAAMSAGTALTAAVVDGLVAATLAGSDLTGTTAAGSLSTGSIESLLRVLSGEVYRLSNGATVAAGGGAVFVGNVGVFVTAPDVIQNNMGVNYGNDPSFGFPVVRFQPPAQTGAHDFGFRNVHRVEVTGSLSISSAVGALSKLKSASFDWNNPAFSYGASGSATDAAGVALASHLARGVALYDAAGNVL